MVANDAESLIRKSESFDQHYDVLHELGRGRFAVVKKCICKKTGKTFAAKIIKKSRTSTQGRSGREQLLLEIDILNNANHPKLVRLYDVFETRSEMQLILEFAAGGDLHRHCIEADVTRTEKEICYLIRQITEAVRYLHDQSIVHLDLKPDNILLAKEGEVFPEIRLIDFGLSRRLDVPYSQFDIVGTPEYVAPEVLAFEPLDYGSDMWSIGVVTYVLLSGISPFAGDDVMETYANIGMVDYDFDCEEFDEISDIAIDFIEKLLERSPRKRMTAREALEHDWLKQLEGGITAVDVAYAKQAQQEPLPDNIVSTPLVDDDYVSSSESETPLEKSVEIVSVSKTEKNEKQKEIENENSTEKGAEEITEKAEKDVHRVEKEVSEKIAELNNEKENLSKEINHVVPTINNDDISKEKSEDILKDKREDILKDKSEDILKDKIEDILKEDEKNTSKINEEVLTKESVLETKSVEKEAKSDVEIPSKDTSSRKESIETVLQNETKQDASIPAENTDIDIVKKHTEQESVAISEMKDPNEKHDAVKESSTSKSAFLKSKSHEETPKETPKFADKTPKRNSTDSGMPNRPSAIEQRKLALQMKMKDESGKQGKLGWNETSKNRSLSTTPIRNARTPTSGSNRSSASSSPGETRKFENSSPVLRKTESQSPVLRKTESQSPVLRKAESQSPVLRKTESQSPVVRKAEPPATANQKSPTTQSPQISRKGVGFSKFNVDKQRSATPESRPAVRGKIPGGIAAKMASKFSNVEESSPIKKNTPLFQRYEKKSFKDNKASTNKEESVQNEIKTSPVEAPVIKDDKACPIDKPLKNEVETSRVEESVNKEGKTSPIVEPVEKQNDTPPATEEPVKLEGPSVLEKQVEEENQAASIKEDITQNKDDNVSTIEENVPVKDKVNEEVTQPKPTPVQNNTSLSSQSNGNSLILTSRSPNKMIFGKPKLENSTENVSSITEEKVNSEENKDSSVETKTKTNQSLKMSEQKAQDIKFSLALGGSLGPSGKKLTIGRLVSCAGKSDTKEKEVEETTVVEEAVQEVDGNKQQHPVRVKLSSGGSVKLGIGRPSRKSNDETLIIDNSSKRAPMLKETKGKTASTSLSRRRAGTVDSSPSSPRKNYRRLYVTKVRNSKVFSNDVQIDSEAAAEIMQRVDNDVLKVEFRLKSTDLKLLPQ